MGAFLMAPLPFILILLSLSLVTISHGGQFTCTYTASDGSYYDLSALQSAQDLHLSAFSAHADFYFAICRDASHCLDSPSCSLDSRSSHRDSYGRLNPHYWTEQYTATNAGVSLVYENGELCYSGHNPTPRTTTLILECDRNVEFAMVDFDDLCHSYATIRSKYACPTAHHHVDTPQAEGENSLGWKLGVSLGVVAFVAVVILVIILGLCMIGVLVRRRGSSSDEEGIYTEMISGGPLVFSESVDLPPSYTKATLGSSSSEERLVTPGITQV